MLHFFFQCISERALLTYSWCVTDQFGKTLSLCVSDLTVHVYCAGGQVYKNCKEVPRSDSNSAVAMSVVTLAAFVAPQLIP